jgi:hypothetical protein
MSAALLTVETLLFLLFSVLLLRKERLFGFYFLAIMVYGIVPEAGYLYTPGISEFIGAYFGPSIWAPAAFFILLSGILLFWFLYFISPILLQHLSALPVFGYVHETRTQVYRQLVILSLLMMLAFQYWVFVTHSSEIGWLTAQDDNLYHDNLPLALFILSVKISIVANVALYATWRQQKVQQTRHLFSLLVIFSFLSVWLFCFKLGDRQDMVSIALALLVYESSGMRIRLRHIVACATLGIVFFAFLIVVQTIRDADGGANFNLVSAILLTDYYPPAHILLAAIYYRYVAPWIVLRSNLSNALVMIGYPYLQAPVTDLFRPGIATRSAGYALYAFSEGYLAAGPAGVIYNGVVLGSLMTLWRWLATTNSKQFNRFLLALMGAFVLDLTRGQSSYFIKYLYTLIVPGILIYLALSGQRLGLAARIRNVA